jgi:hypothetical protein
MKIIVKFMGEQRNIGCRLLGVIFDWWVLCSLKGSTEVFLSEDTVHPLVGVCTEQWESQFCIVTEKCHAVWVGSNKTQQVIQGFVYDHTIFGLGLTSFMYSADARIGVFCCYDSVVTTSKPVVYLRTHCLQYKTICDTVTFNSDMTGQIVTG